MSVHCPCIERIQLADESLIAPDTAVAEEPTYSCEFVSAKFEAAAADDGAARASVPLRVVEAEGFEQSRHEPVADITHSSGKDPHRGVVAGVGVLKSAAGVPSRPAKHFLREVGPGDRLVPEPFEVDPAGHSQ